MNLETESFQIKASAGQLMAKACELTGIDITDSTVEEGLTLLIHSFNTEAKLNQRGAAALEQRLLRLLSNRIRMLRDFKAHPEILEQKICSPLFIVGGPRTGSTKLHKLLASGSDFMYLPFWQVHSMSLRSGDRTENNDERIKDAEEFISWMDQYAPEAQHNHGYKTFEPEEDIQLCEHSFCTPMPGLFGDIPSYMAWWATQDFRGYAESLKQSLQYLQWQFHDGDRRPWVLKCPIYSGVEPILAQVFPGARFISSHRHPLSSVASTANLVNGYRESCSEVDLRQTLGPLYCESLAIGTEQMMSVRDRHPELNILDISFAALSDRTEQVVSEIYAHLGMPLSSSARQKMLVWDNANEAPKAESKKYSLADYALNKEMINSRFGVYIERFSRYF